MRFDVGYGMYDAINFDGGPGSGNHGHKGVKGMQGGSAPKRNSSSGGTSKIGAQVPKERRATLTRKECEEINSSITKMGDNIVDMETGKTRPNNGITESLNAFCESNNIIIENTVTNVDERVTNTFQVTYDNAKKEYPILDEREALSLKHDENDTGGCYVQGSDYVLDANSQSYDNMVSVSLEMQNDYKDDNGVSYWVQVPEGKEVEATLSHELGHVIQNNMLNKFNNPYYKKLMDECVFNLSQGLEGHSMYSRTNSHENFAEGISSYLVENRTPFAVVTNRVAKNWQKIFGNVKNEEDLKLILNDATLIEKLLKEE